MSYVERKPINVLLWAILLGVFALQYAELFSKLAKVWLGDSEFSYGALLPFIVAYLAWERRAKLQAAAKEVWPPALALVALGCALCLVGSLGGTLLIYGLALVTSLMGIVGFLWGRQVLRILASSIGLLLLMVPIPSYVLGQLTWYLQVEASTVSNYVLTALGVPVFQDGNLLRLPNYVLEVKEACSGSRSIFALLTLALVLALRTESRQWWRKIAMVAAAPVLAVIANVVRIVGTGLLAWRVGEIAANESLHAAWGLAVFVIAVAGLLAFQRLLGWATSAFA